MGVASAYIHHVGFLTGLIAFVLIALDLNVLFRTNWNIFTARAFLKKEEYRSALKRAEYLLMTSVGAATVSHLLEILLGSTFLSELLQLIAIVSLAGALLQGYLMRHSLSVIQQR